MLWPSANVLTERLNFEHLVVGNINLRGRREICADVRQLAER